MLAPGFPNPTRTVGVSCSVTFSWRCSPGNSLGRHVQGSCQVATFAPSLVAVVERALEERPWILGDAFSTLNGLPGGSSYAAAKGAILSATDQFGADVTTALNVGTTITGIY